MTDVSKALTDIVNRLGFLDATDLAGAIWVTSDELYQWADEAAKRLAYVCGAFVSIDTSITVGSGTATYALPATHVFSLAVWLSNQVLRITPAAELWALDATWPATSGTASRCSLDAGDLGTITIYPIPSAGGTLGQVCQEYPAAIAAGSPLVALPTVLQDYFAYAMLAGARGKESESAMLEMADHFAERCKLYEAIASHLYGEGH